MSTFCIAVRKIGTLEVLFFRGDPFSSVQEAEAFIESGLRTKNLLNHEDFEFLICKAVPEKIIVGIPVGQQT